MNRKQATIAVWVVCVAAGLVGLAVFLQKTRIGQPEDGSPTPPQPEKGQPTPRPPVQKRTVRSISPRHPFWTRKDLPPHIRLIAGGDKARDYKTRINAVHSLGKAIPKEEVVLLLEFLGVPYDKRRGLDLQSYNAIKNDIIEILLEQGELPEDLGKHLVTILRDKGMDEMCRGYCLQYFPSYYEKRWPSGATEGEHESDRKDFLSAFWEAAGEKQTGIAGTALIGLEKLSQTHKEIDRQKVAQTALDVVEDKASDVRSRITAIQICAMTDQKDVLLTARDLAKTADVIPLRLSAIAAIGKLGEGEDQTLLKDIAGGDEKYTSNAAQKALKNLKERLDATKQPPAG